jgi:hypothetical protein
MIKKGIYKGDIMNILIWLYRSIPIIILLLGLPILELIEANTIISWLHIMLPLVSVYPIVKLENKIFPNNR